MVIFVAEDNLETLAVLTEVLQDLGHEPRGFADGRELIAALANSTPDAILLDLDMPVASGVDVLRHLYAAKLLHVPVIVLTRFTSFALDVERHSIWRYLEKPADVATLEEAFSSLRASTQTRRLSREEAQRLADPEPDLHKPQRVVEIARKASDDVREGVARRRDGLPPGKGSAK